MVISAYHWDALKSVPYSTERYYDTLLTILNGSIATGSSFRPAIGSMFLYAWLHLSGYPEMTIEEIRRFRQLHSQDPGHPELTHAPSGIETSTGPLGQGVGNAVGMAVAAEMAAARFNTPEQIIFDHHVICLCGDGCLQEGVAMESVAFAGHQRLEKLILIYDSNNVTLDAMAKETQSEDPSKKFEAMGWDVQTIDGQDMEMVRRRSSARARPAVENLNSSSPKPSSEKASRKLPGPRKRTGKAERNLAMLRAKAWGCPPNAIMWIPKSKIFSLVAAKSCWMIIRFGFRQFEAWKSANPELAKELAVSSALSQQTAQQTDQKTADLDPLFAAIPDFPVDSKLATRKAGNEVLQPLAKITPLLIGGSADLYGSTLNYIGDPKNPDDFKPGHRSGRNIRFGIREHGMCAILNGIAAHGIFRPSGATFLVFADYCRPSIRLAALSHLPVIYVFTHDSVGVGEDGPTHQPVETLPGLRVIPNLDVVRPADPEGLQEHLSQHWNAQRDQRCWP